MKASFATIVWWALPLVVRANHSEFTHHPHHVVFDRPGIDKCGKEAGTEEYLKLLFKALNGADSGQGWLSVDDYCNDSICVTVAGNYADSYAGAQASFGMLNGLKAIYQENYVCTSHRSCDPMGICHEDREFHEEYLALAAFGIKRDDGHDTLLQVRVKKNPASSTHCPEDEVALATTFADYSGNSYTGPVTLFCKILGGGKREIEQEPRRTIFVNRNETICLGSTGWCLE
ncbi:hypothetical protein VHEMI09888 [[Torrubiella] hemipterigena]|uniref:Ecp2 effector protein domain-containing protein n=1 Tax=[Torrubiella] hemipterigena TaxID=1531966 RepID=A0A0A1TQV6_9HYPO|nr:hypothetical protein VHEMI09888 [[Torrubiella] hemipterigena]